MSDLDIVVTGQRRPSGSMEPFPAPTIPDPTPPGMYDEIDPMDPGDQTFDPCGDPESRKDWDRDAAAAETVKDLKEYAQDYPADDERGFPSREYGAVLWELPDGSIVHGPITYGEQTFQEAAQTDEGRSGVTLDWTRPSQGAVPIGTVHSHPPGGHVPSGRPNQPTYNDYGVLTSTQQWREYYSGQANGQDARLYIAADKLVMAGQDPTTQINVYDHRNIEQAVTGYYTGPEVNPDGEACGSQ